MDNIKEENEFQEETDIPIDNFKRSKKITIDKNYKFVPKNIFFKSASFLLYLIAYPILYIICKLSFGIKIKGRKNLRGIRGAKITISNHIHILDVAFVSFANFPTPLYFPTIKSNLEIPFISMLVKLLKGIPIPNTFEGRRLFYNVINELLENNKTVHFYPEASLLPYNENIRRFKDGAFDFACTSNVPIVPMVYTFRRPKHIMKLIKRKKYITLNVLPPIYPASNDKKYVECLKNDVHKLMEDFFNKNNEF